MDIRNIKQNPPEVKDGRILEQIYELQKDLMVGYIGKIEKNLPNYPISLNSESGQVVLKDFSARVTEETAEGYESTTEALKLAEKYGFNMEQASDEDFDMFLNHLQNSNEEQADGFAFFVELMLYANISPEDIYGYINTKILKKPMEGLCLDDIFAIGREFISKQGWAEDERNLFPLLNDNLLEDFGKNVEHVDGYIPGFRNMTLTLHEKEDHILWRVAYHLNIGRNFLKNKTWKQTQELTDGLRYQEQVVLGFIWYCGYLSCMGFTPDTFYVLFFKKHMVNKFRQKSQY